jgi:hypothetical protein
MVQDGIDGKFEAGDTWPVGSIQLSAPQTAVDIFRSYFTIPGWPEMTGLGEREELVGFWLDLFIKWEESDYKGMILENAMLRRPGLGAFLELYKHKNVSIVKGQLIGPATLTWALKRHEYPVINREKINEFVLRCFRIQGRLLERACLTTIVSLDEPAAFMVKFAEMMWEDFFNALKDNPNTTLAALHTCGLPKPEWLKLPWKVVHFDAEELVKEVYSNHKIWQESLDGYFKNGGWLACGMVPAGPIDVAEEDIFRLYDDVMDISGPLMRQRMLFSTSCGIGLDDPKAIESRLRLLRRVQTNFRAQEALL